MVRKRYNKKYMKIESDESDSDDDFYEEEISEGNETKKYSLRQRRGANFAEDFDYDLIDEADNNLTSSANDTELRSDDDDFDVEDTEEATDSKPETSNSSTRSRGNKKEEKFKIPNCTITKYKDRELEPEIPKDKQSSDDMIDFEDVIRADILVNKSRIDYDSIIEKTEIKIEKRKLEENKKVETGVPKTKSKVLKKNGEPAKKRGRKPKKQKLEEEGYEESQTEDPNNAGLPINTVLGVTESLYELAERYHMQGGAFVEEMVSLPLEPILKENSSTESTESGYIENDCNVALQEPEPVSEAIETF